MHFYNPFIAFVARWYLRLINCFSNLQSLFLFIVRVTWGHQFFLSGAGKFTRMDSVVQFYHTLHIPFPSFSAHFIANLELIGGILLILGLSSRLIALLLAIEMFVAIGTAHAHIFSDFHFLKDPFTLIREEPFPFLLCCLLVLIFGPGKLSLDGWIKRVLKHRHRL